MSRILVIVALACLVCSSTALKKDKFKIKAKGFGLKNMQAPPPAAPIEAPPAQSQPYYPPPQQAAYYPPPAPQAPQSAGYYGNGASAAHMAASTSANLMSAQSSAHPHIMPIIVPIALVASSQMGHMSHSMPHTQSLPLMSSSLGALSNQASSFAYNMPKVDMEYAQYPYTTGGSYNGFSSNGNGMSNLAGFSSFSNGNSNSNFDNNFDDGFSSDATVFSRSSYGR